MCIRDRNVGKQEWTTGTVALGCRWMGLVGSNILDVYKRQRRLIVDQSFWENYLGIRVQAVDMTEVRRRMDQKIYDEAEFDLRCV